MSSKRSSSSKKSRRSEKKTSSTRKDRSRRSSKRSTNEEKTRPKKASSKVEEDRPKRNESTPPRKMGRLMVFYTIERETPIGTVIKEVAMISMIKVWSDVLLIQRDDEYIKIENICDIVKEGNRRFSIKYKDSKQKKSFQAHTEESQEEWLKLLFRVWDDKKSERRRLAQRAERERRILEGRMELTTADAEILHAAQEKDLEKLKRLRRMCMNLDVCTHGTQSRTALHISVMRGDFECVKALLGHVECVKALCEAGSGVSACDADQNTPIHFACWRNDRNIIQLLIRYGGSGLFSSSSSSSDLSSYYDY